MFQWYRIHFEITENKSNVQRIQGFPVVVSVSLSSHLQLVLYTTNRRLVLVTGAMYTTFLQQAKPLNLNQVLLDNDLKSEVLAFRSIPLSITVVHCWPSTTDHRTKRCVRAYQSRAIKQKKILFFVL